MKERLGMYGSELTYVSNVFTAGYVVGQMPAVMLATRIRPSILIPSLEILWSVLTFCSSSVKNVSQLYAIRFLVGLCESGYFPVMMVGAEKYSGFFDPMTDVHTSTSSVAGTPKKREGNGWHCSTVPRPLLKCSAAICKQGRTVA